MILLLNTNVKYSNQALIIRRTKKITFLKEVARLLGKEVNKN